VQGALETAVKGDLLARTSASIGAGRTDAGVHALAQGRALRHRKAFRARAVARRLERASASASDRCAQHGDCA